ncbi:YkgJ family cysteine cluster protein [Desulforamulus ruminis]|uniref:Zinc-or iron-chelating domain-containing protein n=1 Tax=Desulforamulus ruminis (strain ATCC 23193 / DSM 2154 / NCIMB 8452 / DL) TaxID=696281 RepID=F6DS88_DESRL|nr:YkgJ family cysteine cluster protein [Desulforamulus ruminis]AEG59867.1 hypothetical protein Desru_1602 [Desulforamulus ruminis DSM 2154]
MKVQIFKEQTNGSNCYDVRVLTEEATVQDYLDAINLFIDKNTSAPCRGCDECCWERIPLTSVDVLSYIQRLGSQLGLEKNWPLLDFLKRYAYIYVEGQVVDISLGYTLEGACQFLNRDQRICTGYTARSLVCQSYICMESTERAQELRSQLVNQGMDEMVRLWLIQSRRRGGKLYMHEAHKACPQLADYPVNAFSGKESYSQVLLKDVCDPILWNELNQPG